MDSLDKNLLEILLMDARKPISALAGALKVSRATITDRISKLEEKGIIEGYTLRINKNFTQNKIAMHVMISVEPKYEPQVVEQLRKLHNIKSLYAVCGMYDLVAVLRGETTEELNDDIDFIREIPGVGQTVTTVLLSTKIEKN